MKCNLCGYEFSEKESLQVCKGCPFVKKCSLIKCPNCGYEWPKEPAWSRAFTPVKEPKGSTPSRGEEK